MFCFRVKVKAKFSHSNQLLKHLHHIYLHFVNPLEKLSRYSDANWPTGNHLLRTGDSCYSSTNVSLRSADIIFITVHKGLNVQTYIISEAN